MEVKSGLKGGMKSLNRFMQTHPNTPYGLKISQNPKATQEHTRELPLYALESWYADDC